ncbi:hypothetical protein ACWGB8_06545 [Kitasatospora sp. NPDC054939]
MPAATWVVPGAQAAEASGSADPDSPASSGPAGSSGSAVPDGAVPALTGAEAAAAPVSARSAGVTTGAVPEVAGSAAAEPAPAAATATATATAAAAAGATATTTAAAGATAATATATTTAATVTTAAAAATATTGGGPPASASEEDGPRRISRPMIAAAAVAGVVLVGLPLVFSHLGGEEKKPSAAGPTPAGYSRTDGGGEGFVPAVDAHGNVGGPALPESGTPQPPTDGATVPGAPAPAGAPTDGSTASAAPGAPAAAGNPAGARPGGGAGAGGGQPADSRPTTAQQPAPGQPAPNQPAPPAQSQAPAPAQPPAPVQQPAKSAAPTYRAVAGVFCTGGNTTTQQYGWFDRGQEGWRTSTGGWSGDGCNGKYSSVPMSGDARKDDGNSVVWTFNTAPLVTGSCKLSVYVPASGDVKEVGGAPTHYSVQRKSAPGTGTIGDFIVNQVGQRGQWVSVGTYPLAEGKIAVMMHTRGQDWQGSTKTYAHHAASAVKADCTG